MSTKTKMLPVPGHFMRNSKQDLKMHQSDDQLLNLRVNCKDAKGC